MKEFVNNFKVHSKSYLKTNILFFTFVVCSVLNGCLLRFLTVRNYFDIRPMIADTAVVLIVGAFGYFFKPKHQAKYFTFWSIVFIAICIINSIYYNNYVSFVSLSLLGTSTQLGTVTDAVFKTIMELEDLSYIWQLFVLLMVNHSLKKKSYFTMVAKIENGKLRALNTMVAGLIVIGVFISMLTTVDISRFGKQWNREFIVMRFGIYTYQFNDVIASLKPQISPLFGYDEKAKAFREYYETRDNTVKENKYTNVFKGKNLLVIHAESIQNFTLDTSFNGVDVAPNLKRLASEGLYFSNFYAQESVGTSSDTEFTLNTSLMPASSGTVNVSYWDREYITIPKLLKEQGYYAFSMHGNNGSMWNRLNVHKSYGYDKFYNYKNDFKIDETFGLGLSDKSFFRQAVPKIKKIEEKHGNFYGTMIMLTNHTPWTDADKLDEQLDLTMHYEQENEETGEKETLTAPYMKGTTLGHYFTSVHYADAALGQFIEDLDAAGLLENTVVVIYGDHDAKIKKSEYRKFYNYVPETNSIKSSDDPTYVDVDTYFYELNRKVPFIIWTKDHTYQEEITEVMGMIDVLPTLGNMFGFRSPYQLGHDIFSTDKNLVVFPSGNWLTNSMYYNAQKEESKLLKEDATISVEEIKNNSAYAEKMIDISNSIIVYDMIKKTKETQTLLDQYQKSQNN